MKQQKFNKKLQLNKTTIANLGNGEMRALYGGLKTTSGNSCPSIDIVCQTTPTLQVICQTITCVSCNC